MESAKYRLVITSIQGPESVPGLSEYLAHVVKGRTPQDMELRLANLPYQVSSKLSPELAQKLQMQLQQRGATVEIGPAPPQQPSAPPQQTAPPPQQQTAPAHREGQPEPPPPPSDAPPLEVDTPPAPEPKPESETERAPERPAAAAASARSAAASSARGASARGASARGASARSGASARGSAARSSSSAAGGSAYRRRKPGEPMMDDGVREIPLDEGPLPGEGIEWEEEKNANNFVQAAKGAVLGPGTFYQRLGEPGIKSAFLYLCCVAGMSLIMFIPTAWISYTMEMKAYEKAQQGEGGLFNWTPPQDRDPCENLTPEQCDRVMESRQRMQEMMAGMGEAVKPMGVFSRLGLFLLSLFLGTFLVTGFAHVVIAIAGGKAGIAGTFNVVAYANTLYPVQIVPFLGPLLYLIGVIALSTIGFSNRHQITGLAGFAAAIAPIFGGIIIGVVFAFVGGMAMVMTLAGMGG